MPRQDDGDLHYVLSDFGMRMRPLDTRSPTRPPSHTWESRRLGHPDIGPPIWATPIWARLIWASPVTTLFQIFNKKNPTFVLPNWIFSDFEAYVFSDADPRATRKLVGSWAIQSQISYKFSCIFIMAENVRRKLAQVAN